MHLTKECSPLPCTKFFTVTETIVCPFELPNKSKWNLKFYKPFFRWHIHLTWWVLNSQPHPLPTFVRGSAFEPGFIDDTTKITITGLSIPKFMPNSDKMANAIILAYQSRSIYKWSWYTKVGMSTSTKNWNMKIHNASAHMQDCNSLKAWKTKALKREGELSVVKKIKVVRWLVEE